VRRGVEHVEAALGPKIVAVGLPDRPDNDLEFEPFPSSVPILTLPGESADGSGTVTDTLRFFGQQSPNTPFGPSSSSDPKPSRVSSAFATSLSLRSLSSPSARIFSVRRSLITQLTTLFQASFSILICLRSGSSPTPGCVRLCAAIDSRYEASRSNFPGLAA